MPSNQYSAPSLAELSRFLEVAERVHEADGDLSTQRFLMVLRIYRWHLRRSAKRIAVTLEELPTLKHGIRTAELILHEIQEDSPDEMTQRFNFTLWTIVLALTAEVVETEAKHLHLRQDFAREREEYRLMWNDHLEADND